MKINASGMHFKDLNEQIREADGTEVTVENCCGQRYIGSGLSGKHIHIAGTPGNALGAYLDGAVIEVRGNGQDAVGDTMNEGSIIIHGSSGDATGYAMRGGNIFVAKDAGYRAGIHMKAFKDKQPAIVIGGRAGCFLGEYQAGGTIVVLGLDCEEGEYPVGSFCGTGMHGGKMAIRAESLPEKLPAQVHARFAEEGDKAELQPLIQEYCSLFGRDSKEILEDSFVILTPDTKNPYKQLYTYN